MLKNYTEKLIQNQDLNFKEIQKAMEMIMDGQCTFCQIAAFLTALKMKGETITEITECARVLKSRTSRIEIKDTFVVDTCGTGGDQSHTFNISTACAITAAAGGLTVAKHGNRSVSSNSGSADVLEELGVNINILPQQVPLLLRKINICFLFAPHFHAAMKNVSLPRQEMGFRTVFNILGPLINPVNINGHLLGVYNPNHTDIMARVLKNMGLERAMVVHGMDGLDEITTTTTSRITELRDGKINTYLLDPRQLGIPLTTPKHLIGKSAKQNAAIIKDIFAGQKGPARDIVLLNSAAVLYIGQKVDSLEEGIAMAKQIIDSGLAMNKLAELIKLSQEVRQDVG
jgi:anthranilate phosphoribosyltransferase